MISLLVEAALRSCALAFAIWLILAVTRARNPHVQKLIWSAVLIAALAMPLLILAPVVPPIQAPDYVLTLQAGGAGTAHSSLAWSGVLYVLVALALLWRYGSRLLQVWRIRRNAEPIAAERLAGFETAGLDLRVTADLQNPSTFGSTILLPMDFVEWRSQKLVAVLAHERSHVLRRDCYLLWLARLHTCLLWFNPLAWWLQRRLAALAEMTSDEAAVAALGDKPAYAQILLEFISRRTVSDVATAMARPGLTSRIERIISEVAPSVIPKLWQRILVIAALLPAVAAAAAPLGQTPMRLAQSDSSPASEQPSVKAGLTLPELMKYYPQEAERKGIEGLVQIQVSLDRQGRATDTLILSEYPLDMGFGAAASALAHVMEYNNPTGRPAQLSFKVKFALGQPTPAYGTTNFEGAQ
jgi:beta-lactamase regulating signal transducer with metallopeptidase domain